MFQGAVSKMGTYDEVYEDLLELETHLYHSETLQSSLTDEKRAKIKLDSMTSSSEFDCSEMMPDVYIKLK